MICGRLNTSTRDFLASARIRMLIDSLAADNTNPGNPSVATRAAHGKRAEGLSGQRFAGGPRCRRIGIAERLADEVETGLQQATHRRTAIEQQRVLHAELDSQLLSIREPHETHDHLNHDHGRPPIQVLDHLGNLFVVLRRGADNQRIADDFRHDGDLLVNQFELADQRELLGLLLRQELVLFVQDLRQGIRPRIGPGHC